MTEPLPFRPTHLVLVTDAWHPQTNGVVTTLSAVCEELAHLGTQVTVIHPGSFSTWPLPSYPEIRIARNPWRLWAMVRDLAPDAVHVATEGPLGIAARIWLRRHRLPFTTSVHTKFPEYIEDRIGLPPRFVYPLMRWFHNGAEASLCTTPSHERELESWGLKKLVVWGRGVDTERFRPAPQSPRTTPKLLYVGRVAVEKSVEDFLALPVTGEKIVVGDGPARPSLEARFPDARWLGFRKGQALVDLYADADVFVFPSRTDTFGLVMLEAMACGTPVAAYPVTGPIDVVEEGVTGALDEDLAAATRRALELPRSQVRDAATGFSWRQIAQRLQAQQTAIDWSRYR